MKSEEVEATIAVNEDIEVDALYVNQTFKALGDGNWEAMSASMPALPTVLYS